jgi:DNA-directed RNA polymerase subunit beta'
MRTFTSCAAQISEQSFVESNFDGKVKIKNKNIVKNSDGQNVAMVRNMVVAVLDPDGTERATHRIQYGARMLIEDGAQIKRGQRIAEWDPYTRPILTEVDGVIGLEDLVEGQSMSETLDESTGIAKRVVIDWRTGSGRNQQDLRPAIVIKKDNKILKLGRGAEARYQLAVDAIISVEPGSSVNAGDVIARISTESAKTRDITGGLPRVAELFEARRPKEAAIIAETSGTVRFGKDYKNKRRVIIEPASKDEEPREYLIPKGKHIHLQDGDLIEKGDFIVEGNPLRTTSWRSRASRSSPATCQRDQEVTGAGRGDQRQAHRSDRAPDAAEGGDRRHRRDRVDPGRADRQDRESEITARSQDEGKKPATGIQCCSASPRPAADPPVHFGGIVPGDHGKLTEASVNGRSTRRGPRRTCHRRR